MRVDRGCWTSFFSGPWIGLIIVAALAAITPQCVAQSSGQANLAYNEFVAMNGAVADGEADVLPDAPEPQQQSKPDPDENKPLVAATPKVTSPNGSMPVAPKYSKYIPAGYAVEQIHGREKLILGARDLYSAGNFGAMFLSAGWSHWMNGQPNYGTDRGAFGERLGAAGIRETSQGILTDGVFSVMLHQDPRYFVQGSQFGIVHRTLYAISRPLITRSSNDGHAEPNYALWLGTAAGTALNNLYYPQSNRNVHDNLASFGGSIGGFALGYAVDEFTTDLLKAMHMGRSK